MFSHSILALALTPACVKLPRRQQLTAEHVSPRHTDPQPAPIQPATERTSTPVSINRAARQELERLPGVGPALAARIIAHRERHGPFRRPEHLLLVRGISERRLRALRPFITIE